uniref:Endoplasmic reticulum oxidoreductin 1 n=1 Tax=Chenopodium quinoa TaxID=63459 RepID=A0A803LW01_CHEQI
MDGKKKSESGIRWRWVAMVAVMAIFLAMSTKSSWKSNRCKQLLPLSKEGWGEEGFEKQCSESCKFTGMVEDCCCDYETVNVLNEEVLHPLLQELITTPFFRYFKAKLWCNCPFWPDDGMCRLRDCSVCECPENEFPETFRKPSNVLRKEDLMCQEGKPQAIVDRTLDKKVFRGWVEVDNPWTSDDETDNSEMTYVNLLLNPERYTGYTGPSARRIWDAIYSENCPRYNVASLSQFKERLTSVVATNSMSNNMFLGAAKCFVVNTLFAFSLHNISFIFLRFGNGLKINVKDVEQLHCDEKELHGLLPTSKIGTIESIKFPSVNFLHDILHDDASGEMCQEKKVLYKLISGLHASISVHIAADYLLDEATNTNFDIMHDRVLRHPERVRNLYFAFLFVLRAVTKASDYLEQAEYDTGNHEDDLKTQSLLKQLLYNQKLRAACPLPFDEAKLWQGQSGPELKQQIQMHALMDCVGCEKCRLWGKLQVLGLGTALKILLSVEGDNHLNQSLQLQRNEVIALINLLNRLSESVKLVHEMAPSANKIVGRALELPSQEVGTLWRIWQSVNNLRSRKSS